MCKELKKTIRTMASRMEYRLSDDEINFIITRACDNTHFRKQLRWIVQLCVEDFIEDQYAKHADFINDLMDDV